VHECEPLLAGRAVEKYLPKNLKPAIREIIDEGLGKVGRCRLTLSNPR
jgi:hypothetical protein